MSRLDELKTSIKAELPGLDCVIGWQAGFDPLHNTPLFMRSTEDVDRLAWGPLNVHNCANYLPALRGRKVGIVVKGCDSRSVAELIQEKLIDRDNLVIFGMPCSKVVDLSKVGIVLEKAGTGLGQVKEVTIGADEIVVTVPGNSFPLKMADVAADKCLGCQFPNAVLVDRFFGDPLPSATDAGVKPPDPAGFDAMAPSERIAFWKFHLERCIRCYACRNACPLCVCRDHCLAGSREPHWISQENTIKEKLFFQVAHTVHLAGRCTECGECQRACPMDIPILALKRHMSSVIRDLFDYQAGTDPLAVPPLLFFRAEEKNIDEGGL